MSKQTAVEWLASKIEEQRENGNVDLRITLYYCEQAKAMEREQIIEAAERWKGTNFAEQYYNETYKGGSNEM